MFSMSLVRPPGTVSKNSSNKKTDNTRRQLLYDLERHPFEASPLTQLFPVLDQAGRQAGFTVPIPDTVVWENNIPKGWYSFDPKQEQVVRRKVETKQIQMVFLTDARFQNDVVAVQYSMSPSGDKDELLYQFITAAELPTLLFENRKGKGTSILQKFVYPLTVTHNDTIQAVWTPTVAMVTRRQNMNHLFDERINTNTRCATFEGPVHQTQLMQATSRLQTQVENACSKLVAHFAKSDPRYKITRLVVHFKMNDASTLMLLMVTSSRVAHSSYSSVEASINSSIHKKYRVSLELATRFVAVEREDNETHFESALSSRTNNVEGGGEFSGSSSFVYGGSTQMSGVQKKIPSGANNNGGNPPGEGEDALPPSASIPQPYVGSMKASRLGFVMRKKHGMVEGERRCVSSLEGTLPGMTYLAANKKSSRPNTSLAMSSSFASCPSPKAGSPTRASPNMIPRLGNSGRSGTQITSAGGSSANMMPVATVLAELEKAHRTDSSADQKAKAAKLADRLLKKVDMGTIRATYLSGKPETQLTDSERMELFFLKLQDIEGSNGATRKVGSRDSTRVDASLPATPEVEFATRFQHEHTMQIKRRMEQARRTSTHTFQPSIAASGEGAGQHSEHRSAHPAVEARLAEHLYAFQTQSKVRAGARRKDEEGFRLLLSRWEGDDNHSEQQVQHDEERVYLNFDTAVDAALLTYLFSLVKTLDRRVDLTHPDGVSRNLEEDADIGPLRCNMLTGSSYTNPALLQFSLTPTPDNDGSRGKVQSYVATVPTSQVVANQKFQHVMQNALAPDAAGGLCDLHTRFGHLLDAQHAGRKPPSQKSSGSRCESRTLEGTQEGGQGRSPATKFVSPTTTTLLVSPAKAPAQGQQQDEGDSFSVASDESGGANKHVTGGEGQEGEAPPDHESAESVWGRFTEIARTKSEFDESDLVRCSWRTIERLLMEHDFSGDSEHDVRIHETRCIEEEWKRRNQLLDSAEDTEAASRSERLGYDESATDASGDEGGSVNRPGSRASTGSGAGYSSEEFEA